MKKVLLLSVVVALAIVGCGQKTGGAADDKTFEKAVESAARAGGQKVDVDIDSSKQTMTMTVKGEDGQNHTLNMKTEGDDGNVSMTVVGADGQEQDLDMKAEGNDGNFTMSMKSEDGQINIAGGEEAKIPADFPKDVPLYADMKLTMVQTAGDQGMFMVAAETSDPIDKVAEFFKTQCSQQGWAEQMQMSQGEMRLQSYTKENRALNVTLATEEGVTKINLNTANQ
ncbi:MAG TPA: hypothetical protein PLO37_13435 [Candidatus Hydrogenedentes bacterium]|nr:hypothetical protein [Candidatus Hydrogenedentota bacterium]HPG67846.1 hypothetical protein [Candidatus Hydrogenedentota bacterium]